MSDWSNYDSDFDPTKKLEDSDLSEEEPLVRSTVKYGSKGKTYGARPLESSSEEEMSTDEETEDESSSEEDDEETEGNVIKVHSDDDSDESIERYDDAKSQAQAQEEKAENGYSSSSGDENSETCAICLGKLTSTKLPSKPDSGCPHLFCRECLVEWSKQINTCPIDRREFKVIIVYNRVGGHEIAREVCKQRKQEDNVPEEEAQTLCERCGCGDREEALLLCDGCDLGYHMDCLVPSLSRIPHGRWFCPTCEASGLISDYLTQRPR